MRVQCPQYCGQVESISASTFVGKRASNPHRHMSIRATNRGWPSDGWAIPDDDRRTQAACSADGSFQRSLFVHGVQHVRRHQDGPSLRASDHSRSREAISASGISSPNASFTFLQVLYRVAALPESGFPLFLGNVFIAGIGANPAPQNSRFKG